ncbi:MAG: hypothetical protein PHI34_02410 [Acidobacteriota bacterium]|nr:hypothetical protein [Acidobacteriota bacterium]
MLKKRRRREEEAVVLFRKRVRPDPGSEYWDGYWDRLQARLASEPEAVPVRAAQPPARPGLRLFRLAALPAAAAALLIAGFFMGRWGGRKPVPVPAGSAVVQASDLDLRTNRYLDRSRRILLALVNYTPATKDPYGLDLPGQKIASGELVREASVLRSDLTKARERRLEKLVGDLQTILRQIANLEAGADLDAVRIVQAGVEGRDILFQISLAGMRGAPAAGPAATPARPERAT